MTASPRVACFGYVNPGRVFSVEQYPAANTGAYVTNKRPFIGADGSMAAQMLARWGLDAHLIGNALGNDDLGHDTLRRLGEMNVHTHIDLRQNLRTPDEVDISDRAGTRTFFVENNPAVWTSLIDADLSAIAGARMVYIDWYVGEAAVSAARLARDHQVSVYLNVEFSLAAPQQYRELIALATYVQSPMSDVHVQQEDPRAMAEALLSFGARTVFVTRGKYGSLAAIPGQIIDVPTSAVPVADTHGAGAVYSALAMYGLLHDWPVETIARVATFGATLKCTRHGLPEESVDEIMEQLRQQDARGAGR